MPKDSGAVPVKSPPTMADRRDPEPASVRVRPGGLFLIGEVAGRKRRMVGEEPKKEMVEYTINCGDRVFHVTEVQPEAYLEMGSDAVIPVEVRLYTNRAGTTLFSLHMAGNGQGESF